MQKIIKFGFLPVKNTLIRGQNDIKGKKLFESGHVLNVVETEDLNKHSTITCSVVAQTKVSEVYNIKIHLDDNRNIISANCNCKTGVAQQCKHICAAIHFVNSPDSAASKTSQSQGWGKPSHRQLLGYDKGARISTLFPPPPLCSKAEKLTPFHVTTENLKEFVPFSPLFQILQFEERNQVEIIAAETLAEIKRMTDKNNLLEKAKKVTLDIFTLQLVNNLHGVECETLKQWHDFYQNKVCCYVDKALSISIGTIDQSEKSEWFEERKLRITASNGHKVKGNRFDIEKIIDEFLNPSKHETSAMSYGKKTEEIALKEYKKLLQPNWEVVRVGLIVNIPQPWMSCSPDSILIYGPNIWQKKLIEVKCPYSCRNQPIFNEESLEIHVQYLKFDENGLHLSTTHSIYTQIQLQMYVTNIAFCDLFIYSPMGSVLITVGRDEAFLNKVIPALQKFYFQHYLQRLFSMHSKKN
ncbi:uncharacterized protein LOC141537395 [Cotesia typhae]|uniref:uncharacterized protein LOC141537395 n=1 Tax=Cotesia typhae TaxID=2053667 RepID=UPI003D68300D